jgi:glycosyltransferase involved in cell wall biosynthesis
MKISIVIVAYNVEKYIEKCVLSCVAQNLEKHKFEIVIVNDGSTDGTQDILERLQIEYKSLVVIHQTNQGVGEARNIGLQVCTGDYVWFVDGDDYIETNCLASIYNQIAEDDLDALVVDYKAVDHDEVVLNTKFHPKLNSHIQSGSAYYKEYYVDSYFWLFVFKKKLFVNNNLRFLKRFKMQDSELLPKVLQVTQRLGYKNSFCYYYVQHPKSSTNSQSGSERYFYFESIIAVRESFRSYLKDIRAIDEDLSKGLQKKLETIDKVVFNHLLYFKYESNGLNKILHLLKSNDLYPISYQPKGLKKILKIGLNTFPYFTNYTFNVYNENKKRKSKN